MLPGQLDLLSWKGPGARRSDPTTSHDAANKFRPREVHENVLRVLRDHGPLTDHEIAARLGGIQTSYGKRRGELRDAGLVVDSGIKRPSPSGSQCVCWRLK